MGGCCCSSRKPHLNGAPVYYYIPPVLEEHEPLTSNAGLTSALSGGLLIDSTNLEASILDTFRAPPAPLPYDILLGHPQSSDCKRSSSSFETLATCKDSDCKTQTSSVIVSPKKLVVSKLDDATNSVVAEEEEEDCPICLEGYDTDNPKLVTECDHHFHFPCILEWMERSDACPICDKEMVFDQTFK